MPAAAIDAQVFVRGNSGNRNDITLNPMPKSVLLDPAMFSVKEIAVVKEAIANFAHSVGDTDGDGHPEIYLGASPNRGAKPTAQTPLFVLEAGPRRTVMLDAQDVFGTATTAGVNILVVADFDQDGRSDVLMMGATEGRARVVPSTLYLNRGGRFQARDIPPKLSMHNGTVGDFEGDGDLDIVASAYRLDLAFTEGPEHYREAERGEAGAVMLFLNNGAGGFTAWPLRFDQPVEGIAADQLRGVEAIFSSDLVIGNLDGDPELEIVVVDNWYRIGGETESWFIDNIGFEQRHAYGDFWPLPFPYLETKPEFGFEDIPRRLGRNASHDIDVELLDIDNDGDNDIVIQSIVWPEDGREVAGVVQFLENNGAAGFFDVTETVLHNFNLGKSASHDPKYFDVNRDGFIDILLPQSAEGDTTTDDVYRSVPNTWANEILINAGNGTFVSAFRDGFHTLTLRQEAIFQSYGTRFRSYDLFDNKYFPYLLKDGRLGYVTVQTVSEDRSPELFWFDIRAEQKLYTGPRGEETASRGAPGYSEYFYLTEYRDVRQLVRQGRYADGLSHYRAVGRAEGRFAFAPGTHVHGNAGNNIIVLREGNERAFGYQGNDRFRGKAGNDFINGGIGRDTGVFKGPRSAYEIEVRGGRVIVTAIGFDEGTDTLVNVEALKFADQTIETSSL